MHDNIHIALAAVNREIDAIGKASKNKTQNFMFRGIDDAYNSLHDILARHGIVTLPHVISDEQVERTARSGSPLFWTRMQVAYSFVHESGSEITVGPVIGEAMDSGDKGANKALAVAHKYALFQTFTIPTLFSDPDAETHEVEAQKAVPVASEEVLSQINDLKDYMSTPQAKWLENNNPTQKQAERILNALKDEYAKEQTDEG